MVSIAKRRYRPLIFFSVLMCMPFLFLPASFPQENDAPVSAPASETLTLVQATMCEEIENRVPKNPAIVFSMKLQHVYCFTLFDSVTEKLFIHHNWYYNDKLSTKRKLVLQPPHWATFSRIQLREADRGPWRLEITDQDDHVLKIIRFSVTD